MHPLEIFKFCPRCGSEKFVESSASSKKCAQCGFEFYKSPAPGVAALVFNDGGEMLVLRRAKEPAAGSWDLPGGFVEIGETAEEAVVREVKEETGLDVAVEKYLFSLPNQYIYSGMEVAPLDLFFCCRIKNDDPICLDKSENSALSFVAPQDLKVEDFGLPSIRKGLSKILHKNI